MRRVAALGDAHGNAVALAAVLEDLRDDPPDLVVWTGGLSWGWEPAATLELVRSLEIPAVRPWECRALPTRAAGGTIEAGHTHAQYDREVAGIRAVNPGSVGMPYEGRPGAYWALLGPDVELRRTEYDFDEAISRLRVSGFPDPERLVEILTEPPTPAQMIEHAERREFSG